jgi:hypothetical protein
MTLAGIADIWRTVRVSRCDRACERLRRASHTHFLSDASVKKAALDQVDRISDVRATVAALLDRMGHRDERRSPAPP